MILKDLPLARLQFDLQTLEASDVSAYKGDLLRMALLWWLSEFWCVMPDRCRNGCRRLDTCMFGRLCEPPVNPAWPSPIQKLVGDTPPPAYALWDSQDRRRHFDAGTSWSFELTAIGDLALRQIPAMVAAIQQGAEQGMGRIRLRSRVLQVTSLGLEGITLAEQKPQGNGTALTWQGYHLNEVTFGYQQASEWAQGFTQPVRTLSLRYLSPTKIKKRGQWVETPDLSAVMRALTRRLRILSVVHGAGELPHTDYGPLLDLAETVQLEHHETMWTGYTRRSKQSGQYDAEGFIGQAWYSGDDLRPLLPILWLGQWLHIGKGYVMGNGRYSIEQVCP